MVVAVVAVAEKRRMAKKGWGEERKARREGNGRHYVRNGGNAMEHGERERESVVIREAEKNSITHTGEVWRDREEGFGREAFTHVAPSRIQDQCEYNRLVEMDISSCVENSVLVVCVSVTVTVWFHGSAEPHIRSGSHKSSSRLFQLSPYSQFFFFGGVDNYLLKFH